MFLQSPELLLPCSAQNTVQAELWRGNSLLHLNTRQCSLKQRTEPNSELGLLTITASLFQFGADQRVLRIHVLASPGEVTQKHSNKCMQMTQALWCLGDCGLNSLRAKGSAPSDHLPCASTVSSWVGMGFLVTKEIEEGKEVV